MGFIEGIFRQFIPTIIEGLEPAEQNVIQWADKFELQENEKELAFLVRIREHEGKRFLVGYAVTLDTEMNLKRQVPYIHEDGREQKTFPIKQLIIKAIETFKKQK